MQPRTSPVSLKRIRKCAKDIPVDVHGTLDCGFLYNSKNGGNPITPTTSDSDSDHSNVGNLLVNSITVHKQHQHRKSPDEFDLYRVNLEFPFYVAPGPSFSLFSETSILDSPTVGLQWWQIVSLERRKHLLAMFDSIYSSDESVDAIYLHMYRKKDRYTIYVPRVCEIHQMYREKRAQMAVRYTRDPGISLDDILRLYRSNRPICISDSHVSRLLLYHSYELVRLNRMTPETFQCVEHTVSAVQPEFVTAMRLGATFEGSAWWSSAKENEILRSFGWLENECAADFAYSHHHIYQDDQTKKIESTCSLI